QEDANFLARMELVRAVETRLRQHPGITGCLSVPDFQPVAEPLDDGASMVAKSKYLKRAALVQEQIRDHEIVGTEPFYALAGAPLDLVQTGDELWRISAQVQRMSNRDYGDLLRDVHNIARDVLRFQPGARHLVAGELPVLWGMQQAILRGMLR